MVYEATADGIWHVLYPAHGRVHLWFRGQWYVPGCDIQEVPDDVIPCSVHGGQHQVQLSVIGHLQDNPVMQSRIGEDRLCYVWLLANCNLPETKVGNFLYQLLNGQGMIHTDGPEVPGGNVTFCYLLGYSE